MAFTSMSVLIFCDMGLGDLGLRMTQGISTAEFEEQFGKEIHAVYGGVLKKYEAMHLLQEHSGRLALTRDGISVSNVILADFLL